MGTDRVTEFVYVLPLGEFEKVLYCLACPHGQKLKSILVDETATTHFPCKDLWNR